MKSSDESFRIEATGVCNNCRKQVNGWMAFNESAQVVDSGGFMVFATGITCDECLESSTFSSQKQED